MLWLLRVFKQHDAISHINKLKIAYLKFLMAIKNLNQILNMDEAGFHSRIEKGRKRKCAYFRNVDSLVTYWQEAPSTTLCLMCWVLALGICLPPTFVFITKENVSFHSKCINEIKNHIICRNSQSGYATKENMIDWIELALKSYSNNVQNQIWDPNTPIFLILDNCSIHNSEIVMTKFHEIVNLKIIWLPLHSSHFCRGLTLVYLAFWRENIERESLNQYI